ncbi:cupin domain-containing protein [Teichococcus oryzae]|uniref:Cupin domain-containing protein n=1 Tax=Teichococcus oryzae TaxID=1608942 RepID=A0A5B2TG31_9PROT|nr:cupin domain-containing protein [Pseudoroseomonas oryzae]KAA2213129.1 cupin domain-containing protein [Pseudoroseomonas oryzae]
MSCHSASDLQVTLANAARRLSANNPFATLFERGDAITVELYAPIGADGQLPHDRDELYIVAAGSGRFRRDEEVVEFGPGDLLYVPAHVPHRFESFTEGFKVWVIFFGAPRPAP